MADPVASHYSENLKLADAIAEKLRSAGKDLNKLTTADLVVSRRVSYSRSESDTGIGRENEFERPLARS